jgi:hypothetical protein
MSVRPPSLKWIRLTCQIKLYAAIAFFRHHMHAPFDWLILERQSSERDPNSFSIPLHTHTHTLSALLVVKHKLLPSTGYTVLKEKRGVKVNLKLSSLPTLTSPAGLNVQTHSISTLLLNHESGGSGYNNNMVVASIPLVKIRSFKAFYIAQSIIHI